MVQATLKHNREEDILVLTYKKNEYQDFVDLFESAGMEVKRSSKLFGHKYSAMVQFYEMNNEGKKIAEGIMRANSEMGLDLVDDVALNVVSRSGSNSSRMNFNVGIFRVIPVDGIVMVPLGCKFSLTDFLSLKAIMQKFYEYLAFNIGEEYIEVSFGKKGGLKE